MSKTIFKYPLSVHGTELLIHKGARIMVVGNDPSGNACLWAEVQTDNPTVNRFIACAGTGHSVPEGEYIGTICAIPYMWHFYDEGDRP